MINLSGTPHRRILPLQPYNLKQLLLLNLPPNPLPILPPLPLLHIIINHHPSLLLLLGQPYILPRFIPDRYSPPRSTIRDPLTAKLPIPLRFNIPSQIPFKSSSTAPRRQRTPRTPRRREQNIHPSV
ncbi:hypothetical protein AA313_de0205874 [Arthrobotrys entomopaga]|nr:hypothetical protein AA313_de0205874 [Arthrobotrys entomopaga]